MITRRGRSGNRWAPNAVLVVIVVSILVGVAVGVVYARVQNPKFGVGGGALTGIEAGAEKLLAILIPEFAVKNANIRRYHYRATTVEFFYGNAKIGEATLPDSNDGRESTARFRVAAVGLSIGSIAQLSTHVSAGLVPIMSSMRMEGRAKLWFIKKNRAINMNCNMDIGEKSKSSQKIKSVDTKNQNLWNVDNHNQFDISIFKPFCL